jgi:hypothetical protein
LQWIRERVTLPSPSQKFKIFLGALEDEAEAFRGMSPAPYQTTHNIDNVEAHIRSLMSLKDGVAGLNETLQRGFVLVKLARFKVT